MIQQNGVFSMNNPAVTCEPSVKELVSWKLHQSRFGPKNAVYENRTQSCQTPVHERFGLQINPLATSDIRRRTFRGHIYCIFVWSVVGGGFLHTFYLSSL